MSAVLTQTRLIVDSTPSALDPLDLAIQEAAQPGRTDRAAARRERVSVLAAALDDPILGAQVAEVTREFTDQMVIAITDAQQRGLVRADVSPGALATMVQAVTVGYVVTDVAHDLAPTSEDWLAINRLVIDALRPPN